MWQDPIVEEVRAIRDSYAKQFDYDIETIYRDLKKQEANSGRAFVSLPPKRIEHVKREEPGQEAEDGSWLSVASYSHAPT